MSNAKEFDRQVGAFEKLRNGGDGFLPLRQSLLKNITGNVLEIALGPGFNFPFYKNITSLTAIDLSPKMIESAKREWQIVSDKRGEFIVGDMHNAEFADNEFDAVVSTCSLCAYDDPVAVLNRVAKWCKPEGFVYLLEHGLSDHRLMRAIQRLYEPIHYTIHACHCDRDIKQILEQSDLEIISYKKPRQYAVIDFMYSIIARPK